MGFGDFFRRVLIPVRQRPSSADLNALQWRQHATDLISAGATFGQNYASSTMLADRSRAYGARGFSGGGFRIELDPTAPPFGVRLQPGFAYNRSGGPTTTTNIDSNQGADWEAQSRWAIPLALSAYQQFTVPAPPGVGNSRIDIIEVRADYLANDPQTVGIFNTGTEVFNPTVLNKSLTWDLYGRTGTVNAPNPSTACISYVVGQTVAGGIAGATEPSVTPGYLQVARINLDASGGAIAVLTDGMLADKRIPLWPMSNLHIAGTATIPGVVGGLGSEAFPSVELPMGVLVKMVYANNAPPAAGVSYVAKFYVIGGDLRPRTTPGSRGVVTANSTDTANPRCLQVYVRACTTLGAGDVAILDGTDTNYTVVNGVQSFAVGQPVATFSLVVLEPTGAALNNAEEFQFSYVLNMG